MPITLNTITLEYKLLPIVLNEDGTSKIVIRKGYMSNGIFNTIEGHTFEFTKEVTDSILDKLPIQDITRREDLAIAIYLYLVNNGLVEQGQIS